MARYAKRRKAPEQRWLTLDEIYDFRSLAEAGGDGDVSLPARELMRLVKSHLECEDLLRNVRAACRREIVRIQNTKAA